MRSSIRNVSRNEKAQVLAEIYNSPGTGGNATAPAISNVNVSNVTINSAQVTWTTDSSSDSQVEYGATSTYSSKTSLDTQLVTSHSKIGISRGGGISFDFTLEHPEMTEALALVSANLGNTPRAYTDMFERTTQAGKKNGSRRGRASVSV
jgi:hypothetical protein